jgi:hypothetical protein
MRVLIIKQIFWPGLSAAAWYSGASDSETLAATGFLLHKPSFFTGHKVTGLTKLVHANPHHR